jgi:hypothetical protein
MSTVSTYVDNEYARLSAKRKTISEIASAQRRAIILNESYRKRFSRYTQIVMIISFTLIVYLGVLSLRKMMPGIPETATDILLAVIFFIGLALCINIMLEITSRSITNYDELDLPPLVEDRAAPTLW